MHAAISQNLREPNRLLPPHVDMVVSYLKVNNGSVFGANEWIAHCGIVPPPPALPVDIEHIWQSRCPFFGEGKKISDTHMLIYIPTTVVVNDKECSLTLKNLGEIAKSYFSQNIEGYRLVQDAIVAELGDKPIARACWVLMTKQELPGSRFSTSKRTIMADLAKKDGYEIPKALEAAVCILSQYFSSQIRLFNDKPWNYTLCQDMNHQVVVGGFTKDGLGIDYDRFGEEPLFHESSVGIAALRKFS